VASTGEGHVVEFRTGHFYGMTTHARGAAYLFPGSLGVLDMGALHARAIRMSPESRVLGYAMTSQCASGSGQFIENIARYLGVTLSEVGELSRNASGAEKVSGICAVLAETDVINMVSRGIPAPNILRGIHLSMADRLAKLLRTAKIEGTVVLTGGLANDVGLTHALQGQLELDKKFKAPKLVTHEDAIYAGAIGAALWGAARYRRLASRKATGARSEATA
jgi:benzoyl-CoA reductase subunit D